MTCSHCVRETRHLQFEPGGYLFCAECLTRHDPYMVPVIYYCAGCRHRVLLDGESVRPFPSSVRPQQTTPRRKYLCPKCAGPGGNSSAFAF